MSKKLKPFFGRIGTKRRIKNEILKRMPYHNTYVEPFVGGGAILLAKEPVEEEIINDIDSELMENYRLLKDIKDVKNADINPLDLKQLNEYYADNTKVSDSDKLIKYILKSCNTFGCLGTGKLYINRNYEKKTKNIPLYQKRLKNVKMFNISYEEIIKEYDNEDTFFFLDPPYENSNKLYKHDTINYVKLKEIVKNIKGHFLLTLNDSPSNRELFKDFNIECFKINGLGNVVGEGIRYELFIKNY